MLFQNHLNKNNVSPVTKQRMGSELMKAGQIKALADKFLEENPELLPAGLNVDSAYSITVRRSK